MLKSKVKSFIREQNHYANTHAKTFALMRNQCMLISISGEIINRIFLFWIFSVGSIVLVHARAIPDR